MPLNENTANLLTVQKETTFNAVSAETKYAVPGKVAFRFNPILSRGAEKRDIWRNAIQETYSVKHYEGMLTLELGINVVTKLLLESFMELENGSAYDYRPRRTTTFGSLKFGLEYNPGGPNYALHGVVINSLEWGIQMRNFAQLKVGMSFVRRETGVQMSTGATEIAPFSSDHMHASYTVDAVAPALQEFTFQLSDKKTPVRFDEFGAASRFAAMGDFQMTGSAVELFGDASVLQEKVETMANGAIISTIADRTNPLRYLRINWPKCAFMEGTPDGITRADVVNRFSFIGLQDSALDKGTEPLISLVL